MTFKARQGSARQCGTGQDKAGRGIARSGTARRGEVRQGSGRGYRRVDGLRWSSTLHHPRTARYGGVGHGCARRGVVRRGKDKEIEMGDWQASGFKPSTPTQQSGVRQCWARLGVVWQDVEWLGTAWHCQAREWRGDGLSGGSTPPTPRRAWRGVARLGMDGQCEARQCRALQGNGGRMVSGGVRLPAAHATWRGLARQCVTWLGQARNGDAG